MTTHEQDSHRSLAPNLRGSRPNVILITLDACRYDLLVENLDSLPNLKSLAQRSVFFENAFSAGPATAFAFPAIIGGVYPYHWGPGIHRGVKAVDEVVKGSGYHTSIMIEFNPLLGRHFGYGLTADFQTCRFGLGQGDVSQSMENGVPQDSPEFRAWRFHVHTRTLARIVDSLRPLWERNRAAKTLGGYCLSGWEFLRVYARGKGFKLAELRHNHNLFRQNVLDFINDRFENPQFLWMHTMVNHGPYQPPSRGSEFSPRRVDYLNARGVSKFVNRRVCRELKRLYVESLTVADDLVGDVVGALSARGLLEDSIIILTADHGEEFMEEDSLGHSATSSSDTLLHVPLMISLGHLLQPRHIQIPVSTLDVPSTICDLLGIGVPDSYRGISLKPLLSGSGVDADMAQELRSRPLFSAGWSQKTALDASPGHESHNRVFTVRKNGYKLKVTEVERGKDVMEERLELVDWVSGHRLDLSSNREVVEELRHLLCRHVYEEGVMVRSLKKSAEQQHVKDALSKVPKGKTTPTVASL